MLAAFAVGDAPVQLSGGQGRSWRAGRVILKPVEFLAEALWRAQVLDKLAESTEFRVARPVRAADGAWVVDGWEASLVVEGEPDVRRQDDVLRAGIAFHAAVAELPRPAFLDHRTDPWAMGDRAAWGSVDGSAVAMALLASLIEARRPVDLAAQVVHGDLAGNVLFADGLPPAVIDWSVYWRPTSWASAVAVVDALCWYGAEPELAARWAHLPEWGQMLVRALIYRIVTHDRTFEWTSDQIDAYRPAIELAVGYAKAKSFRRKNRRSQRNSS
ncbi:MAG TPA: TIGR02569 family protein [Pseudonocardiaceae bacterium]